MKLLLEIDHYVDDVLLPKGAEVGDGKDAVHDWRYRDGPKKSQMRPLSRAMSPLDEEAKKAIQLAFGEVKPSIDPTAAIPIQGTTNAPGLASAKAPGLATGVKK